MVAQTEISKAGTVTLEIANPELWNTEHPYLYTLILQNADETIEDAIALRTVAIQERVLYFNGQAIKLRGVNRHDWIRSQDLQLMLQRSGKILS